MQFKRSEESTNACIHNFKLWLSLDLAVCLLAIFLCFLLDSVFFNLFIRTICNSVWMYVAVVVTISRNAFLFIIFYNKEMSFSIECNGELNGH